MLNNENIIAAAIASTLAGLAGYWLGDMIQARETAAVRAEFDAERVRAATAHARELDQARAQEQAWQAAAHESEKENAKLKEDNAAAVARAADAARRLRDAGANVTRALNNMSADAAATGERVARAASASLGECGERLAEVGARHDQCEIERRTLIGAWPRRQE